MADKNKGADTEKGQEFVDKVSDAVKKQGGSADTDKNKK